MTMRRIGHVNRPGAPNIHLGAACREMVSVCLTASDKAGTLAEQTREVLETLEGHLEDNGSSRAKLLMAQVWLADIAGFAGFRDVWNGWVDPENVPALSVVEAAASRRDTLVEIRVYAAP